MSDPPWTPTEQEGPCLPQAVSASTVTRLPPAQSFSDLNLSTVIEACPAHHSNEECSLQHHLKSLKIFCFAPSHSYPCQSEAPQLQSFVISH